ncbi:hypothetical protein AAX26_01914 [Aliarcobacter thereius]|uniref:SAVED domain-containing protein n=1 Tax=Aliarcobacter thereius TaxID=544718 RepID=UPI000828AE18|nr:SAVED domain-containing protein [Aliarcobacter thereius]OCL85488.1 hypothetical protein AAX26_01914 [Aliarcobacter thereius]TLT06481.1 SAVED domain-containing protein [Aliarcobacter thereius]
MKRYLENAGMTFLGIIALILGPFYDAIDNPWFTWTVFAILLIILVFIIYDIKKKDKILNEKKVVDIPIVIKVDDGAQTKYIMNELIKSIEKNIDMKDYSEVLQKYYSINIDRFIFEDDCKGDFDKTLNLARVIKYNISQLEDILQKPIKIHLLFYRRPAIAFLIGTIFRTNSIDIYQTNNKNTIDRVMSISNRKYKEKIYKYTKYEKDEYFEDKNSDEVLLIIDSASHNVNENASDLKIYKNRVIMKLIGNGTIPVDVDWEEYVQEIYNAVNELQTKYKKIVIAHSMPEALAVGLGMGFGEYWNVHITQYNYITGEYQIEYKMNDIKYYI